jgi:hypothetical protein
MVNVSMDVRQWLLCIAVQDGKRAGAKREISLSLSLKPILRIGEGIGMPLMRIERVWWQLAMSVSVRSVSVQQLSDSKSYWLVWAKFAGYLREGTTGWRVHEGGGNGRTKVAGRVGQGARS